VKSQLKKVDKLLTYAILLESLIAVYVQFVIILIEIKKVLSQKLKCLCSKATILSKRTVTKTTAVTLLYCYCIINKYIVWECMYTAQKCPYTVYTLCMYSTGLCVR
jgi:hypothetical protein